MVHHDILICNAWKPKKFPTFSPATRLIKTRNTRNNIDQRWTMFEVPASSIYHQLVFGTVSPFLSQRCFKQYTSYPQTVAAIPPPSKKKLHQIARREEKHPLKYQPISPKSHRTRLELCQKRWQTLPYRTFDHPCFFILQKAVLTSPNFGIYRVFYTPGIFQPCGNLPLFPSMCFFDLFVPEKAKMSTPKCSMNGIFHSHLA